MSDLQVVKTADPRQKIARARTRLVVDLPFIGALVLHLPEVEVDPEQCKSIGTDGRKLYFNAVFIEQIRTDELTFLLAHEALHCALLHFSRRKHRDPRRWDLACDLAINPILVDEALTPPPGILLIDNYRGMGAEEIYNLLDDCDLMETVDEHYFANSDSPSASQSNRSEGFDVQGSNLNSNPDSLGTALSSITRQATEHDVSELWSMRLASALQQSQSAGNLSAVLNRVFEKFSARQVPWREMIARVMTACARENYSWHRPRNRRTSEFMLPSLKSEEARIALAIDVSASISKAHLGEAIGEIQALKDQFPMVVSLYVCDSQIVEGFPRHFEQWEALAVPETLPGGGSTDFRPVFDDISLRDIPPDLLIWFTDARGRFPKRAPEYPVTWLVIGEEAVPWGNRVQFN